MSYLNLTTCFPPARVLPACNFILNRQSPVGSLLALKDLVALDIDYSHEHCNFSQTALLTHMQYHCPTQLLYLGITPASVDPDAKNYHINGRLI